MSTVKKKEIRCIGAIIPAYNESEAIAAVVKKVRQYVSRVVVIDDGSCDQTAQVAEQAGASIIIHKRNRGKGIAIKNGFDDMCTRGVDAVIILDGDGQHDPGEIPHFVQVANELNADIVLGNRMVDPQGMPFLRFATNKVTSLIISKIIGASIKDTQCGYRLLRSWILPQLRLETSRYDTETEMLLQAGIMRAQFENIQIKSIYQNQKSEIRKFRDTVKFLKLIGLSILKKYQQKKAVS
ncbi:glycosyltransferase family 2 protein [Chlamydiota bacterium]